MSRIRVNELQSLETGKVVEVDHIDTYQGGSVSEALDNRAISVGSVIDLLAIPTDSVRDNIYIVGGYYHGSTSGGGVFAWDSSRDKSDANGGTIIDPAAVGDFDGSESSLGSFLMAQGAGAGSGCWVRSSTESYCPYDFGYAKTFSSGMFSCSKIIEVCKKNSGGSLVMPNGEEFLLGGHNKYGYTKSYVEAGSNFSWIVPAGSVVIVDSVFGVVWRPTGYGIDGGEKNFVLKGGGVFRGRSRAHEDNCFLSLNFTHVRGIYCSDITFDEVANGHIFDLMGVGDVYFDNCKFIGSTLDFSGARAGVECIQIDVASDGSRRFQIQEDNKWMDLQQCSNLNFKNMEFKAKRAPDGSVLSHTQISIGAHGYNFATVDSINIQNLIVEQSDPDAVANRDNHAAIRIPPCHNFSVDGFKYTTIGGGSGVTIRQAWITVTTATYQYMSEESVGDQLPTYATADREPILSQHMYNNMVLDMRNLPPGATLPDAPRILATKTSSFFSNITILAADYGTDKRDGYDVFALSRDSGGISLGGVNIDSSPLYVLNNITVTGIVKNFIYAPTVGRYKIYNCNLESGELSFELIRSKPELIDIKNSSFSHPVANSVPYRLNCDKLSIAGSVFSGSIKFANLSASSGYCMNNVLPAPENIGTGWVDGNIDFSGNVNHTN